MLPLGSETLVTLLELRYIHKIFLSKTTCFSSSEASANGKACSDRKVEKALHILLLIQECSCFFLQMGKSFKFFQAHIIRIFFT